MSSSASLARVLIYKDLIDHAEPLPITDQFRINYIRTFDHVKVCDKKDCLDFRCALYKEALEHADKCTDMLCGICSPLRYQILLRLYKEKEFLSSS